MTTDTTTSDAAYTRLHITPFSPDLLRLVVPTSLQASARNISYHTVETRPDQPYGFVDLPVADAERIRKKLNGAVLKGSKIRVQPAKADTMPKPAGAEVLADPVADSQDRERKLKKREEKSKKRKRNDLVIEAVQLEEGRKVKRGWTEPSVATDETAERSTRKEKKDKADKKDKKKDKKSAKKVKSQYTAGQECLVKTVIPAGKAMPEESKQEKKRKKKGHEREVVVHEFENTKGFPSFLKSSATASSAPTETEYVDGVGWVGQDGTVVQPLKSSRPTPSKEKKKKPAPPPAPPVDEDDSETSSSGSSSESEDEDDDDEPAENTTEKSKPMRMKVSTTSVADLPSESSQILESPRPKSSGSARNLSIKIPPPITPAATKVHPLEALYKRAKTDGTPGSQAVASEAKPFSFFGESVEDGTPAANGLQIPMTPFTQEDFEWRRVRSAAPTPDTAHPNKTFKLWPRDEKEDDIAEEDEAEDEDAGAMANGAMEIDENGGDNEEQEASGATTGGDFKALFWEKRGDLNRSWKRRKKVAAKTKRYRENKARADRAI